MDRGRSPRQVNRLKMPALDAWCAELSAGTRTCTTFDPLWRAACAERWAGEFTSMSLPFLAESSLAQARRIIAAALKGRAA
jgi:hypothetical protein